MLSPLWFVFALTLFTNGSRTKDDPFGDDADDHFEGNGLNLVALVETDDYEDEDDQVTAQKPTFTAPEQRILLSGKAAATISPATVNLTESSSPFTTPMPQRPSLKPGSSAELTQHVVNGIIDMGEEQTGYVQNSSSLRTNTTTEEHLNKNKFFSENGFVVLGSQGEAKVDKEVKVGGRHMKKKGKKKVNFVMMGSDLDGIKIGY